MIKGISESMNKGLKGLMVSVMLVFSVFSYAESLPNKLENIDFRVNKDRCCHYH